jgi:hypothetical protein
MRKTFIAAAAAALTIATTPLFVGSLMAAPVARADDSCAATGAPTSAPYKSCVQTLITSVQAAVKGCKQFPDLQAQQQCVDAELALLPAGVTLPGAEVPSYPGVQVSGGGEDQCMTWTCEHPSKLVP